MFLKKHYSEVLAQSQVAATQRTVRIFPVSSGVVCTFHPYGQVRVHHHRAHQPWNHSSEPQEFVQRSGQKLSVIATQDQASPLVSGSVEVVTTKLCVHHSSHLPFLFPFNKLRSLPWS